MTTDEVSDHTLVVADGRTVGWTECGPPDGVPVVRMPGTPGCRWSVRGDRAPWSVRNLRMITTERPGFGLSSPLPGRGFAEHARDVAQIIDHLDLERVHVIGSSGGAPHVLALAALRPDLVRAATVIAGAAPLTNSEAGQMVPVDVRGRMLARNGDLDALCRLLEPLRAGLLADPLAGFQAVMSQAPQSDQLVMLDPLWQLAMSRATREALAAGVDGWLAETVAVFGDWSDFAVAEVATSVTWWHATGDRNAPVSAAQRLVESLTAATLLPLPDEGHFTADRHEATILDELLARG